MTDIRLVYNGLQGRADFQLVGSVLDTSFDLATAYVVSLFSDRLVAASDPLPPGTDDRRGWWGDSYADTPGDLLGSRLWLLNRAKSDNSLPLKAKGYILESVQWAVDDGIVARNDCSVAFFQGDQRRLGAVLTAFRPDGSKPPGFPLQFDWVWQQIATA